MGDKYIGLAKNSDDIISAIQLVKKVFDENNKKENLIFPEESLKLKNIVVVKIDDNIVATCLIHNRLFYFKGKKIPSAFLCFICVDKKMRGKGISKELMNFTIKICKKNKVQLSFVIARKAVDYYYSKFSFFGFSNYPKILIKSNPKTTKTGLIFLKLKNSLINEIIDIYNDTYEKLIGGFHRDFINWKFIIKKGKTKGVSLNIIKDNDLTIGYICFKGVDIYEIALNEKKYYPFVLNKILMDKQVDRINLHMGINHPISKILDNFDYTFSFRKCWYGGHMIRVNDDREKFKILLDKKIQSNILSDEIFNIPLMDQL